MLAVGCSEKAPTKPATELRVPLPEGWVANGSNERLLAGPRGRSVVSLEPKTQPMPIVDALAAAVMAQKATLGERVSGSQFVALRYVLDPGQQPAFVGVKTVGERTVWCASMHGATRDDVDDGLAVCRELEPNE